MRISSRSPIVLVMMLISCIGNAEDNSRTLLFRVLSEVEHFQKQSILSEVNLTSGDLRASLKRSGGVIHISFSQMEREIEAPIGMSSNTLVLGPKTSLQISSVDSSTAARVIDNFKKSLGDMNKIISRRSKDDQAFIEFYDGAGQNGLGNIPADDLEVLYRIESPNLKILATVDLIGEVEASLNEGYYACTKKSVPRKCVILVQASANVGVGMFRSNRTQDVALLSPIQIANGASSLVSLNNQSFEPRSVSSASEMPKVVSRSGGGPMARWQYDVIY